ncbi:hypothetical protein ALO35_100854 [Pseudomonas amygdali pv. lachrymans]|uniref:Uncharacterized protein n=6 Tax=Pseudomonas syringae group TaxID=136849 RepID=A0A1S6YAE1_PSEAJ|nr:hypothetical protein [Pseudomonas amygdali]AQX41799.1 hypothetical protein [Pseudomonas amygdali pv. tabaci]KPX66721.1 hypothetical protein ALO35_100854 [Pseudomonas amygdali pv. lachrymans]
MRKPQGLLDAASDPLCAKREGIEMSNEFEEIETLRCLLAGSRDRIKFLQGEIARFESIFEPTHLMCLRGGEKLLELCAPDGKFIGVSWNDMAQVLAAMVQASPIGSGKAPKIVDSLQAEIEQLKAELAGSEKDSREQIDQVKKAYEFLMLCRQDKTDTAIDAGAMRDANEWLKVAAENLGAALCKPAKRGQAMTEPLVQQAQAHREVPSALEQSAES